MAVQISGNDITVPRDGSFTRNVTIGGTLTYEDVTNIDSVGLVTARTGIEIGARPGVAASISVDGNMIVSGIATIGSKLGIGGITPSNALDVQGGATNTAIVARSTDSKAQISLVDNSTTSVGSVVVGAEGDALFLTSGSGGDERLRIDSSGRLLIGTSSTVNSFTDTVQIFQNTATAAITVKRASDNAYAPYFNFIKSRGTTNSAATVLQSGDVMGYIRFSGTDGTDTAEAATIQAHVDGTPGDNDMPGRLVFYTTADGSQNATERLRIASDGKIGINESSPANYGIHASQSSQSVYYRADSGSVDSIFGSATSLGYSIAGTTSNHPFVLFANNAERLRITSGGKVLIGDDTAENTIGLNARVQTFGTDASTSGVAIRRGSNDAQAAFLVMSKSRNTSVGSRTILQNGDEVGNIFFAADDGTDLVSTTAAIKSQINGAPGANDTPGNLSFWTTADGANTAVQRMTIDSNGHVTKPYQFHIEVDRDSDQTGYNAGANFGTPMIFNRVIRTIGTQNSALDTSTGKITVPVAGVYMLEAAAYATTAAFQQGWFTENAGRMNYSDHVHAGETSSKTTRLQTVGMHYLAANTEVGYKPYGSGESNVTIGDSVYHTWMRVTLIG